MSQMLQKSYFLMIRKIIDLSRIPPAMDAHHEWVIALEKQGKVFIAGPTFGQDDAPLGGLTLFRAESHAQAAAMASRDPFVTNGAVTFEIIRWQINEGRVSIAVDFSDQACRFD